MKNSTKTVLFFLVMFTGCSPLEDCFKRTGSRVVLFPETGVFDKVFIHSGIALVVKQGETQDVYIETGSDIAERIHWRVEEGRLIVQDQSSCNWGRAYGQTTVYITTPGLVEIESKSEQPVRSEGVLSFPELRLVAYEGGGEAGTGDFSITVDSEKLIVHGNSVTAFYLDGYTDEFFVSFYSGLSRCEASGLIAKEIVFFQRSANDMILHPVTSLKGDIYSTGNVVLKNNPQYIEVTEHYTGKLITAP